jgi:hypothetical protein
MKTHVRACRFFLKALQWLPHIWIRARAEASQWPLRPCATWHYHLSDLILLHHPALFSQPLLHRPLHCSSNAPVLSPQGLYTHCSLLSWLHSITDHCPALADSRVCSGRKRANRQVKMSRLLRSRAKLKEKEIGEYLKVVESQSNIYNHLTKKSNSKWVWYFFPNRR